MPHLSKLSAFLNFPAEDLDLPAVEKSGALFTVLVIEGILRLVAQAVFWKNCILSEQWVSLPFSFKKYWKTLQITLRSLLCIILFQVLGENDGFVMNSDVLVPKCVRTRLNETNRMLVKEKYYPKLLWTTSLTAGPTFIHKTIDTWACLFGSLRDKFTRYMVFRQKIKLLIARKPLMRPALSTCSSMMCKHSRVATAATAETSKRAELEKAIEVSH